MEFSSSFFHLIFFFAFPIVSAVCPSPALEIPFGGKNKNNEQLQNWLEGVAEELEDQGKVAPVVPAGCPFRGKELPNGWKRPSSKFIFSNISEEINENVEANDFINIILYSAVAIGTPAQNFNMVLDSSMLFSNRIPATYLIKSSTCERGMNLTCEKMRPFDPSQSTSFNELATFGNFSVAEDTISLGNVSAKGKFMLLDGSKFVGNLSHTFEGKIGGLSVPNFPQLDGVLSLAFCEPSAPLSSGMEYLLANREDKVASVYVEPTSVLDFFKSQKGAVTVGGLNSAQCSADWHWNPILPGAERWQIMLNSVTFGGTNSTIVDGGCAHFSSLHAFIYGPEAILAPILKLIKPITRVMLGLHPKDVAVECDRSMLPNITFNFADQDYTLTPEQYVLDVVVNSRNASQNICHLMIRPIPGDLPEFYSLVPPNGWFFGQAFFNYFCVAFDYASKRIGFASHL